MTADRPNPPNSDPNDINIPDLVQALRRKEGTWVEWGQACQSLQKAGLSPQQIFEDTGFEPNQQNQIIVAMQVYLSMLAGGVSDAVRSHFERRGSDTLYEFRILTQEERAKAATLAVEKGVDSEGSREVAKAIKDFSRMASPPDGFAAFADHPGDAIAYHYWRLARQQSDLAGRSRLIAMGLRFADTTSARRKLEELLTDLTVTKARKAPLLPIYRMDSEEQLPRVIPVVGKFPLTVADVSAVPLTDEAGSFRIVKFSGTGAWVAVPGWQVILIAEDPVGFLIDSDQLPSPVSGKTEEVLVIVDRAQRQWTVDAYFLAEQDGQATLQWFEDEPSLTLLGRVILMLRPKKILDEEYTKDPWQIEE